MLFSDFNIYVYIHRSVILITSLTICLCLELVLTLTLTLIPNRRQSIKKCCRWAYNFSSNGIQSGCNCSPHFTPRSAVTVHSFWSTFHPFLVCRSVVVQSAFYQCPHAVFLWTCRKGISFTALFITVKVIMSSCGSA